MSKPTVIWMLAALICCCIVYLVLASPSDGKFHPAWMMTANRAVALGLGGFVTLIASISVYRDPADKRRYVAPTASLLVYLAAVLFSHWMFTQVHHTRVDPVASQGADIRRR